MAEVKASFTDLTSLEVLQLDFNPNEVSDNKSADVSLTLIPGSSHPKVDIGSGGSRNISFLFRVARATTLDNLSIVRDKIAWLQAATTPYIDESFGQKFWSPLQWKWGDLYDLPVVIRSVNSNLLFFDYNTALPEWADTSINLEIIAPETVTVPEIRSENKGFVRFLT